MSADPLNSSLCLRRTTDVLRERGWSKAIPYVLLATKHETFAKNVASHLTGFDFALKAVSLDEARLTHCFHDYSPDVAFLDAHAQAADGSALYATVFSQLKTCQVILVCTPDQASEAAGIVRARKAFDYVLIDAVADPNRIPLLVQRAHAHCLPKLTEVEVDTAPQLKDIAGTLSELRRIIKCKDESPIIKMIEAIKTGDLPGLGSDAFDGGLATAYQCSLVDMICGRIKRLENAILSSDNTQPPAVVPTDSNTILIVDNDPICGEIAESTLRKSKFNTVLAATIGEARAAIRRHMPALVLTEAHVGDADGLELVASIRAGDICPNVPVVVTTSDRKQTTVIKAVGANVQAYLLKPYLPIVLIRKINGVLEEVRRGVAGAMGATQSA